MTLASAKITFVVKLPPSVSRRSITEWLEFKLGFNGSMDSEVEELFPPDLEAVQVDWDWMVANDAAVEAERLLAERGETV